MANTPYGRMWNSGLLNRSKEITRNDEEKTFTGKPHIILNLIDPSVTDILKDPKMISENYLTEDEFFKFKSDVNSMIGDPSYQFAIIEMVADRIDSFWKYKKLGGTWIETKADALKNLESYINETLGKVEIEVAIYYSIEAVKETISTSAMTIGKISGEQIKSCEAYASLVEASKPYMTKKIEDDMKPLIENDEAKIENDIYMLNILLKKYPNYKELLDTIKQ